MKLVVLVVPWDVRDDAEAELESVGHSAKGKIPVAQIGLRKGCAGDSTGASAG